MSHCDCALTVTIVFTSIQVYKQTLPNYFYARLAFYCTHVVLTFNDTYRQASPYRKIYSKCTQLEQPIYDSSL